MKKRRTNPVVMYPGDEWEPEKAYHNQTSLKKYKKDYDKVLKKPLKDFTKKI